MEMLIFMILSFVEGALVLLLITNPLKSYLFLPLIVLALIIAVFLIIAIKTKRSAINKAWVVDTKEYSVEDFKVIIKGKESRLEITSNGTKFYLDSILLTDLGVNNYKVFRKILSPNKSYYPIRMKDFVIYELKYHGGTVGIIVRK